MRIPTWQNLVVLVLLSMASTVMAQEAEKTALAVVKMTADEVLAELKANEQELAEHPNHIFTIVEKTVIPRFDFESMSRLVLGKHWRKATSDEKTEFIEQFKELLVRTYATALQSYSDQEIHYLPLRKSKKPDRATVMTEVRETGGPAIPIHYRLKKKEADWKVYDVVIDGISLVSNYRSSFNSQIRRIKLSGLIEKLRLRNEKKRAHEK